MAELKTEPTRSEAERLLEEGVKKNPGPWREHSYAVAKAAEKIARAVNQNCGSEKLNPDLAYCYGLLHDIGRQEGHTYIAHVYDGYHFLMSFGYEKAAQICLTHSFNLKTTEDYIGKIDISDSQMEEIKTLLAAAEYDDYDLLIQLLDSTCGADGTKNLEQRMGDVKARYGYYPQSKWNKNFELKAYFEMLAGREFYDIIGKKMEKVEILKSIINADGIIIRWPKKKEEKHAVLEYLISKFELGKKYSELEVNMIIKKWHSFGNHSLLRRELYDNFLIDRTPDCHEYWVHEE